MHICFVAIFVTNSIWLSISINISSLVFVCSRWQGTVSDSSQQSRAGWPREVSCSGVSSDGKWKCLCVSDPWSAAPCPWTRVLIVTAPTTLTSQETLVLNQGKMFWRDFPEKQGISNACVQKIKGDRKWVVHRCISARIPSKCVTDDMRFKTGGFNGLVNRSRGSDQVMVNFTCAFFSQLPSSPELPFLRWLQPNQVLNRVYCWISHAIGWWPDR